MPLFGAPQGISQAIGDVRQLGQLAMQPDVAELTHAQAGLATLKLQEEQAFSKALQGSMGGVSPTAPISDQLARLSELAFKSGAVNKGVALAKDYGVIKAHEAAAVSAKAREVTAGILAERNKAQWVATHAMDAQDQQSWQQVNAQYEQQFGEPSPYKNTPYSPDLTRKLQLAAMTAKERADLKLREANNASLDAARQNTERHQAAGERIQAARLDVERQREARQREKDAGGAKAPPAGFVAEANDLLTKDYIDIEPQAARLKAREVAERAQDLVRKNRALTMTQAVTKAYSEMQASGSFDEYTRMPTKAGGAGKDQKSLAESYGQTYDPAYEYRVVGGALQRKKKE